MSIHVSKSGRTLLKKSRRQLGVSNVRQNSEIHALASVGRSDCSGGILPLNANAGGKMPPLRRISKTVDLLRLWWEFVSSTKLFEVEVEFIANCIR